MDPFRLFGNTYYVGTAGLSSILVTSERGHILLDARQTDYIDPDILDLIGDFTEKTGPAHGVARLSLR